MSALSIWAGGAVGTAVCPVVGTVVGVGVSVLGYLVFDKWGLRDYLKDLVL